MPVVPECISSSILEPVDVRVVRSQGNDSGVLVAVEVSVNEEILIELDFADDAPSRRLLAIRFSRAFRLRAAEQAAVAISQSLDEGLGRIAAELVDDLGGKARLAECAVLLRNAVAACAAASLRISACAFGNAGHPRERVDWRPTRTISASRYTFAPRAASAPRDVFAARAAGPRRRRVIGNGRQLSVAAHGKQYCPVTRLVQIHDCDSSTLPLHRQGLLVDGLTIAPIHKVSAVAAHRSLVESRSVRCRS